MALFVFGAGATRGASFVDAATSPCLPPLDRDFFTQLQRVANPKHHELVNQVMKDVVELFGSNFEATMETVFSTLEQTIRMVRATGETRDFQLLDLRQRRYRLQQAIAAVLEESLTERQGSRSSHEPRRCDHHRRFVSTILAQRDSIISFNYDCLLDFSLKIWGDSKWNSHYGYGFNLGSRGCRVSGDDFWQPTQRATKDETVHFFKLHGSLHFKADDPEEQEPHVTMKNRPYTKQGGGMKFTIIPPESHKEYEKGIFGALWKKASEAIYRAERIVVIGYSLPATDLHSSTLFRTSVRSQRLKSLVVVNPDPDARRRIRTVFLRGFDKNTRVLSFDRFQDFLATDRSVWG